LEKFEMKKTLVAIAALASVTAFAQSSVTLSGNMDAGHQSINYKGGKAAGITNNGSSTSTLGFSGEENLGGGMAAIFKLNTDYNVTSVQADGGSTGSASVISSSTNSVVGTAGTWLNSEKFIGLKGGFGQIMAGTINSLHIAGAGAGTPFGTAVGSGFRTVYTSDALAAPGSSPARFDNSLQYNSPSMNGISGNIYWVGKNVNATGVVFSTTFGTYDTTGIQGYRLNYNQGPINAHYTKHTEDASGTNATVAIRASLSTLSANYTMGNFTAYYMDQQANSSDSTLKRKSSFVGARYITGPTTLMVQTGTAKLTNSHLTSTTTFQVEGGSSKITGMGADYALSKRTTAYVRTERIADAAGMASARATIDTATSNTITRNAIGVRHTF
jgi:predicted porin